MLDTKIISCREAVKIIKGLENGRFFTVCFLKRTEDKETGKRLLRVMNCRQRVKKYLAGGPAAYSFNEKGLVSVFDMGKMAYRSIPIDGLRWIRVDGEELEVDHNLMG